MSHEQFFKEMLVDIDTPSLPFGLFNVHIDRGEVAEQRRMLPQDLNDRLRTQAKKIGVSLSSLCHVAWAQVVARTSGQHRVVFGTVVFGQLKTLTHLNHALGPIVSVLPIRVDVNDTQVEDT
ncbi:hypothetical protein BGZ72_006648, partial [Mortierella alpina]